MGLGLLTRWGRRYDFWQSTPPRSYALFLAGVFLMFLPVGLLGDIAARGANRPSRLAAEMIFSGGIAVVYVSIVRRPRWLGPRPLQLPALVAIHFIVARNFDRLFGALAAPLAGDALAARLTADTRGIVVSIVASFVLLSQFIRREALRSGRAHAEIALAGEIHRRLVPRVARRDRRFEFRGVSLASGAVGGDLVDVVGPEAGWIAYVADVSGHGVAAGLLMGMTKAVVRTRLGMPGPIDRLMTDLDAGLVDLKAPQMFVTFAGLQFDGGYELSYSVAGHLPILHYRTAAAAVDELTIAQVPLAMFGDRTFASARIAFAPGDLFVILTDGLTEVFDRRDREFGFAGVKDLIGAHATEPLAALEDRLFAAVRAHGPQLDDQTVLFVRVLP